VSFVFHQSFRNPTKRQDNINKATAKLLKNYPPPMKKGT